MKRLSLLTAAGLLASTPLFAMDGGGVSISGEANFGVKFAESDDDSKSELQFHHEFKVTFAASGTTDGGIGFGGEMTLDNTESVTVGKTAASKGKRDWIGDSLNADIISRQDDGALGVFTTGASGGFSTTFGTGNTTITKDNLNDALGLNKYEVDKAVPGEIVFVREGQLVRIKPDDVEKSGWTLRPVDNRLAF